MNRSVRIRVRTGSGARFDACVLIGSVDPRKAEDSRAPSTVNSPLHYPPAQCKLGALEYNAHNGKALVNDAQQECLRK